VQDSECLAEVFAAKSFTNYFAAVHDVHLSEYMWTFMSSNKILYTLSIQGGTRGTVHSYSNIFFLTLFRTKSLFIEFHIYCSKHATHKIIKSVAVFVL